MAILNDTKRRVIVNAGHYDSPDTPHYDDTGATTQFQGEKIREAVIAQKIRDALVTFLADSGFEVLQVPDHLDLAESIEWANEQAPDLNDALAIDIHLNYMSDPAARGTEAFHGWSDTSAKIADAVSANTANSLGIPDRGAKPDTETYVGELGWIRKTTMWATLVEVAFLTNEQDMEKVMGEGGYALAAHGIAKGIGEVFGAPIAGPQEDPDEPESSETAEGSDETENGSQESTEDTGEGAGEAVRAEVTVVKYDKNDEPIEVETYKAPKITK